MIDIDDLKDFLLPAAVLLGAYLIYNKDKSVSDQVPTTYEMGEDLGETVADVTAGAGAGAVGFLDGVSDTVADLAAGGVSAVSGLDVEGSDVKAYVRAFSGVPGISQAAHIAEAGAGAVNGYLDSVLKKQQLSDIHNLAQTKPKNVKESYNKVLNIKKMTQNIVTTNKMMSSKNMTSKNVPLKAVTVGKKAVLDYVAKSKNPIIKADKKILSSAKKSYSSVLKKIKARA